MATEPLVPTGTISNNNWSSYALSNIDTDDSTWQDPTANNVSPDVHLSFPTSSGTLTGGPTDQVIHVKARKFETGQTSTPTLRIEIWESGSGPLATSSEQNLTGSEVDLTFSWDGDILSDSTGANCEIKIFITKGSGGPSARSSGSIQYVEWTASFAPPTFTGSASITAGSVTATGSGQYTSSSIGSAAITVGAAIAAASGTFEGIPSVNVVISNDFSPSYQNGYARTPGESVNPGLWKDLIGAWVPALGVTGLILKDVSGFGDDGVFFNMELEDWTVDELDEYHLQYDGSNEHVQTSGSTGSLPTVGARITTNHTIMQWLWKDSTAAGVRPFCIYDWNDLDLDEDLNLWYDTTSDFWYTVRGSQGDEPTEAASLGAFPIGEWVHVTGTYDGTTTSIYKNGLLMDTGTVSTTSGAGNTEPLIIGADSDQNDGGLMGNWWDGKIGPTYIWNRILSEGEIRTLCADPLAPFRLPSLFLSVAITGPSTYTGSSAATIASVTAVGSGTHEAPLFTGSSTIIISAATATASGTFDVPVYSGSASITIGIVTATASGQYTSFSTGSATIIVASATATANGTFEAPLYTGSSVITLGVITATATGTFEVPVYSGSAAITASVTATASGTHVAPSFTGSSTITVGTVTAVGSGTFAEDTFTGSAAIVATAATATGSGQYTSFSTGSATITVASTTALASGTFDVPVYTGSATPTVGSIIAAALGTFSGGAVFTGSVAVSIALVTATGSGQYTSFSTGSSAVTIGSVIAVAAGTFEVPVYTGSAAIIAPAAIAAATGTFTTPLYTASASITVGSVVATGTGTYETPVATGSAAIVVPATLAAGTGFFGFAGTYSGSASIVIGSVLMVASGQQIGPLTTSPSLETLKSDDLLETIADTAVLDVLAPTSLLEVIVVDPTTEFDE